MTFDVPSDRYKAFEHTAWERAAENYADSFEAVTALFAQPLLDAVRCGPGLKILDVACGSGMLSAMAESRGASATGIDFSPAMIAAAKGRFPSLSFIEADAERLPFADGSNEAVVIGFGVHHFPSPLRALQEAHRVLRAGGRLAFTVWSSSDHVLQQLLINVLRQTGAHSTSLPSPPQGDINEIDQCTQLLNACGCSDSLSVRKLEACVVVSSAESLIDMFVKGTARASALLRAQPASSMPAIVSALNAAMTQYKANGALQIPAVAILAAGSRA